MDRSETIGSPAPPSHRLDELASQEGYFCFQLGDPFLCFHTFHALSLRNPS
jgi:hypothetical protein